MHRVQRLNTCRLTSALHRELELQTSGPQFQDEAGPDDGRVVAIEKLESYLAQVQATLADVTQQSGSIQASLVGLPDQQELRWMLDRRFAIDTQLRHAASMRVRAFRSEPPAYLINALGQPPTDSWSLSRWERTSTDIEKHRLRWEITDKRNALGSEIGDPRMERACSLLRDEIERTARELAPRHVRQRTFVRGR